ncbi:MAG: hypothetical protein IT284_00265 [Bacteroidetes bacterium]|nr:hypothetical protein [Bacteroidota bacterium]
MWKDLLWLLGFLVVLFFIWANNGGPERAREENIGPVLNGTVRNKNNDTENSQTTEPAPKGIEVTPL